MSRHNICHACAGQFCRDARSQFSRRYVRFGSSPAEVSYRELRRFAESEAEVECTTYAR